MIVPVSDLIARLREQPKFYVHPGLGMRSFYRARAGRALSIRTKETLLTMAREFWPSCIGLLLADGSVHYSSALVAELAARNAELEAENARLRAEAATFTRRAFRQLVGEGRLRSHTHEAN